MKFIVDVMLANLGRWLRIMGFYTEIVRDERDEEIIFAARERGLILVTRDRELYERASKFCKVIFVEGKDLKAQVIEVLRKCKVSKRRIMNFHKYTKCTKCGGELLRIKPPSFVKSKVAWKCRVCGQIYWEGSHWKKIKEFLNGVIGEI